MKAWRTGGTYWPCCAGSSSLTHSTNTRWTRRPGRTRRDLIHFPVVQEDQSDQSVRYQEDQEGRNQEDQGVH